MNIKKSEDGFSAESAEVIGILVFESEPESISIDPLRGEMRDFCRRNIINEGFRGKAGTSLVMAVADKKVKSVVICGIGKDDSSCEDRVREAMFKVVRSAAEKGYPWLRSAGLTACRTQPLRSVFWRLLKDRPAARCF